MKYFDVEFNRTDGRLRKKAEKEVKDGLISRHRMDDVAYIQEQLREQFNNSKQWIKTNEQN